MFVCVDCSKFFESWFILDSVGYKIFLLLYLRHLYYMEYDLNKFSCLSSYRCWSTFVNWENSVRSVLWGSHVLFKCGKRKILKQKENYKRVLENQRTKRTMERTEGQIDTHSPFLFMNCMKKAWWLKPKVSNHLIPKMMSHRKREWNRYRIVMLYPEC